MASAIDPTKPTSGNATTESVRANFAAAKAEIEALQEALNAVPQGVGWRTVTAGESLAERDVVVLGADLKAYKAAGGAAVATSTSSLPDLNSIGAAYNPATNTIVLVHNTYSSTLLNIVSGIVNDNGTVTLGVGFSVGSAYGVSGGVLDVCHVGGDVFFACWRSSATTMSALAFIANGTSVSAPQPTQQITTSSTTAAGQNACTTVAYEAVSGRVFAATPGSDTSPAVYSWTAPTADCILEEPATIVLGTSVYIQQWAALVPKDGYLYWLWTSGQTYSSNMYTNACVIDAQNHTISPAMRVTNYVPSSSGRIACATAHTLVGNSIFLTVADHGTTASHRSVVAIKELQISAGTITLPGGLDSGTAVYTGASGIVTNNLMSSASMGYDSKSGKIVIGVATNVYKTFDPVTKTQDPASSSSMTSAGTYSSKWHSRSVECPGKGVMFFRSQTNTDVHLIWNLKPSRPSNLSSVTYAGFAKTDAAVNTTATVLTAGAIVNGFSDLTPLSAYYALPANTVSTVQGTDGVPVGVAISPSQLLLRS